MDNLEEIGQLIRNKNYRFIGVDGTNGAGKSTMASKLSKAIGLTHINLDDFLNKKQGGYLEFLKYDEIKRKISELDSYIIDGVCLMKVLGKIQISIDCLIYVKRMRHGIWSDEEECNIDGDVEEFIKKEKEVLAMIDKTDVLPESLGLAEEIIHYHAEYKPHEKADIFFERNDC